MPVSADDISRGRRDLDIPADDLGCPGEFIRVTYRPNYFDLRYQERLEEAANGQRAIEAPYGQLMAVIEKWDVLAADGQPVPLTMDGLGANNISAFTCNYIVRKVIEDMSLPEASRPPGNSGSRPTAASANSRTSGRGSGSRETSTA